MSDSGINNQQSFGYNFNEIVQCNMCGDSTDTHKILGQRLNRPQGLKPKSKSGISVSVMKCNDCGLIYTNPQPIPIDFQDHYGKLPEDYWLENYFEIDENYFASQIEQTKSLIGFKDGMKALDIGAGIGKCLVALENAGFDSFGLEPSETFFQKAISGSGISEDKLKLGMVEEIEYPENSFDFITYGAVFEHLYDPAVCLEKSLMWLKPGGLIHIEVPSSDYFIAKLYNSYFKLRGTNYVTHLSPMHEPYHLYEFRLKSFEELSKRLKFEIVKYEYYVCDIFHIPRTFHRILSWYMNKTETGMQLAVWLKKQ